MAKFFLELELDPGAFVLEELCRLCRKPVENDFLRGFSEDAPAGKLLAFLNRVLPGGQCEESRPRYSPYLTICLQCSSTLDLDKVRESKLDFDKASITVLSAGSYKGLLRDLIRTCKYLDDKLLAVDLGRYLANSLIATNLIPPEKLLLIPVPLHRKRLNKRGFNQALVLAKELGRLTDTPVRADLLKRIKATTPQFGLSIEERRSNLEGAFALNKPVPDDDSTIVLVDDLFTTGNTLIECARPLIDPKTGKSRFYAFTVCRAD
ncbi:MAG TPA: ComF family protein [Candidatus Melainabacteria bacterium]|nr:ComF family protein [Candidatus Melainabacteria bacterium]